MRLPVLRAYKMLVFFSTKRRKIEMSNLYVSDLNGTLLRSNETLSQFTIDTINDLTSKVCFFLMQQLDHL